MKYPLFSVLELIHLVSLSVMWFGAEGDSTAPLFSLLRLVITVYFYISEGIIGKSRFFKSRFLYIAAFTGALPVLRMSFESIKGRAGVLSSVLSIVQFSS